MRDFSGSIGERVEILKRTPARDALGAPGEDWTVTDLAWVEASPIGRGAAGAGEAPGRTTRWRITLRPCAVAVSDRIDRTCGMVEVLEVVTDPALPDRITIIGEDVR